MPFLLHNGSAFFLWPLGMGGRSWVGKRDEQEGITSDDLPLAPWEEQLAAPHSYHISMPLQRTLFTHELFVFRAKFHFPSFYPSFDLS